MSLPGQSADGATSASPWTAHAAWWGGFFLGPLIGVAVALSEPKGSLNRAHGAAAAALWCVLLAFWIPFTAYVILLGQADETVLLFGLPGVVVVALAGCAYGSIQASRGRTPAGRTVN